MIRRTVPASYIPRHLRTGLLRRIAMDRPPIGPLRAMLPLHLLFPAPSNRRVPRLPACDRHRMSGPAPIGAPIQTPTEHEIADAYAAHPYAPKPPAWVD